MIDAGKLNDSLQKAVRSKLPNGTNIANILSDILFIGKEAIYRRLRGEVAFSLHEAAMIARKLNISLDSIIQTASSDNPTYELISQRFYNLRERDYDAYEEYLGVLKFASMEPYSEQVYTSNLFPLFPSNRNYLFSKYNSFRWMYLNMDLNSIKTFHDMEHPERQYELSKAIIDETMNIKNTLFIWDNTIIESIIKEIKYFRSIRLMNDEDVNLFKSELHTYLDTLENIASKGRFETGNKVQIFISNINTDTAYSYLETPNIHLSMIGAFTMNYMVSLDTESLQRMKNRVHTLKRVSSLISESGEIQRIQFFKAQHELVDTL